MYFNDIITTALLHPLRPPYTSPSNFMYFVVGFFKSPLHPVSAAHMRIGVEHPSEHGQLDRGSPPTIVTNSQCLLWWCGTSWTFLSHLHCNADRLALCNSWVGNHSWVHSRGNGSVVSKRHWLALTSGSGELYTILPWYFLCLGREVVLEMSI